ncbi:unnamed protein product [Protopolystoma xenopodis]|uniref:Uncharacterized protein n=1 Tax=Protopolystoma xenopodis TaxID=117903 RepID=A0A448XII2_9PLAT|nr:unnamed protein product [Protopolystoma xenopodis]
MEQIQSERKSDDHNMNDRGQKASVVGRPGRRVYQPSGVVTCCGNVPAGRPASLVGCKGGLMAETGCRRRSDAADVNSMVPPMRWGGATRTHRGWIDCVRTTGNMGAHSSGSHEERPVGWPAGAWMREKDTSRVSMTLWFRLRDGDLKKCRCTDALVRERSVCVCPRQSPGWRGQASRFTRLAETGVICVGESERHANTDPRDRELATRLDWTGRSGCVFCWDISRREEGKCPSPSKPHPGLHLLAALSRQLPTPTTTQICQVGESACVCVLRVGLVWFVSSVGKAGLYLSVYRR